MKSMKKKRWYSKTNKLRMQFAKNMDQVESDDALQL